MHNLVGKTLGQYEILEELGSGGMAVVYKAYQPALDRRVALKVLPRELTFDQEFVERFLREAKAAARLNHPNIVTIHDVGQADDGYYIVMEYVDGPSLTQLLRRRGALDRKRTWQIVSQVASALDYAHDHGFTHRDIKPGNILLDADGVAKLTDFGIVKAAEGTRLTRTGALVGTPAYMSPEQARGDSLDHRTDIYSLGVVVYEMLSGRVPFRGDTMAVLHGHAYEEPALGVLPSMVRATVAGALAKHPGQRFASAGALATALQAALVGSDPGAEPTGRQAYQDRPRVRPPRMQWLGGFGAAALLIAVGLIFWWMERPTPVSTPGRTLQPTSTRARMTATLIPTSRPTEATAVPTATPSPAPTTVVPPTPTPSAAQREEELLRTLHYREANGDVVLAERTEVVPTIDGRLSEWHGRSYDVHHLVHDPDGKWRGPVDLEGRFHALWDEDRLYVGVEVMDDVHVQIASGEDIWQGDDVEIQIDGDLMGDFEDSNLNRDDGQVGLSAGDFGSRGPEAYVWRPPYLEQPGGTIVVEAQKTTTGYTLEAAIPWRYLGGRPPVETAVGFCLSLGDNDTPGTAEQQTLISTAPARKWGDPRTWGTLVLVDWR